jgi:hypothetical protein
LINKTIHQQGRFQINLEPIDTDAISMGFLKGTFAFDWLLCPSNKTIYQQGRGFSPSQINLPQDKGFSQNSWIETKGMLILTMA